MPVSGLHFQNLHAYVFKLADQEVLAFAVTADVKRERTYNSGPSLGFRPAKPHSGSHLQEGTLERIGVSITYGIHRNFAFLSHDVCHGGLFNSESHAGREHLRFAAMFVPMCFSFATPSYCEILCRGTSDRVWRSATELRASLTNSDGDGIRTRDLPINSRSNPCLHHRQKDLFRDAPFCVSVK